MPVMADEDTRDFAPFERERAIAGICYGPFRDGQAPGQAQPNFEEIREDLRLLADDFQLFRVYGSDSFARQACEIVRLDRLPLKVIVGVWLEGTGRTPQNEKQVNEAIAIANDYQDVVCAISVGNETQVHWSFHKVDQGLLIEYIRQVREATSVPVTVADDFLFWIDDASAAVANEVDFIITHIYAMWHAQSLDDAMAFTKEKYEQVCDKHPEKKVVIGEAGWATAKSGSGDQAGRLLGEAGEAEQARFYREFSDWAARAQVTTFYFEAFDENWKGGPDPQDAEKHWGLYRANRQPKQAIRAASKTP